MDDQKPTIGRIVHYRKPADATMPGIDGDFHLAAIVTMTPEEWTPGYRDSEGEWHEVTNSIQPSKGCVHLHMFPPPLSDGTKWTLDQLAVSNVPYGTGPGTWSWPPRV